MYSPMTAPLMITAKIFTSDAQHFDRCRRCIFHAWRFADTWSSPWSENTPRVLIELPHKKRWGCARVNAKNRHCGWEKTLPDTTSQFQVFPRWKDLRCPKRNLQNSMSKNRPIRTRTHHKGHKQRLENSIIKPVAPLKGIGRQISKPRIACQDAQLPNRHWKRIRRNYSKAGIHGTYCPPSINTNK